jgi:hypothetical protein
LVIKGQIEIIMEGKYLGRMGKLFVVVLEG